MPRQPGPQRKGGARPRRKGTRAERELVILLRQAGIDAARVPLSGAAGGRFAGDIILGDGRRGEVKIRRTGLSRLYALLAGAGDEVVIDPSASPGWRTLERWLRTADVLFARAHRAPWVVVERWQGVWRACTLGRWIQDHANNPVERREVA